MQLSLFYDYERICRSSSFFQKFETLFLAVEAISDEKTLHKSTGRLGYGPICFLKALIYKNAQQIASIPELLRDLESRPLICDMIGFPFGKLPDSSNFYRFLNGHKNSEIQELLYKSNKLLLEKGLITTDIIIADSKPIKACTKENNPKNPNRSLNKNDKIKWNPKATLGYYSYIKQPLGGRKKKFSFFWGYRTHVLVSKEGIPLVEVTRPNNFKDHRRKTVFSWVMQGMMNGNSIISSRKTSRVNPISPSIRATSRNPRPWDRITDPCVKEIWK